MYSKVPSRLSLKSKSTYRQHGDKIVDFDFDASVDESLDRYKSQAPAAGAVQCVLYIGLTERGRKVNLSDGVYDPELGFRPTRGWLKGGCSPIIRIVDRS